MRGADLMLNLHLWVIPFIWSVHLKKKKKKVRLERSVVFRDRQTESDLHRSMAVGNACWVSFQNLCPVGDVGLICSQLLSPSRTRHPCFLSAVVPRGQSSDLSREPVYHRRGCVSEAEGQRGRGAGSLKPNHPMKTPSRCQ